MYKRIFSVFILLALLITSHCQPGKSDTEAKKFAAEFETIQKNYVYKMNNTSSEKEQASIRQDKVKDLEKLLNKYDDKTSSEMAELLKSKLLIEISRFKEANLRLDELINMKSSLIPDAKMAKVQILIGSGETGKALKLFKEIEPQLKEERYLFTGWLYVSLYSNNIREMESYSHKFLETPGLPESLAKYKANIYWNLAVITRNRKDIEKTKGMLKKAISVATKPGTKLALESELQQIEFIGKPAFPISADTWINSLPLSLEEIKGKVVVIEFWATWCSACRKIIPVLNREYNKYKTSDLVVIGYTRLYGNYQDEKKKTQTLDRKEEEILLRQFIKRHRISYPIAISHEGYNFDDYKITAVPTIIFIDKYGKIDDIITGAGSPHLIRNAIKKLLEETNGKN